MHTLHRINCTRFFFAPIGSFLTAVPATARAQQSFTRAMRRNWALSRGIAEWVEVRPTRLPLGSHERGLFVVSTLSTELEGCYRNADGRNVIRKGTYIGLYRGEFKPRNGSAQPYRGSRRSHAMETDDHFIVPPATASHSPETVNTLEFSISAVNEVPQGGT